jgi:hypothetical protein
VAPRDAGILLLAAAARRASDYPREYVARMLPVADREL